VIAEYGVFVKHRPEWASGGIHAKRYGSLWRTTIISELEIKVFYSTKP
jgi:hypothetical protein